MAKLTKAAVKKAHDEWARAAGKYGNDNLETIRLLGAYYKAKDAYKEQHGKEFQP